MYSALSAYSIEDASDPSTTLNEDLIIRLQTTDQVRLLDIIDFVYTLLNYTYIH